MPDMQMNPWTYRATDISAHNIITPLKDRLDGYISLNLQLQWKHFLMTDETLPSISFGIFGRPLMASRDQNQINYTKS